MVEHCTPEQLALAALREPLPDDDRAHLAGCGQCSADVASLRRGVDALAVPEFAATAPSAPPPPSVWAGIAAATGVSASPRVEAVPGTAPRAESVSTNGHARPSAVPSVAAAPAAGSTPGTVVAFPSRRNRWLLAAAAVLVVGAAGVTAVVAGNDDGAAVASTRLDPLEGAGEEASGRAEVVDRDGGRLLEVQLDAPALDDRYYEVWLLEPEAVRMVPVGIVRSGTTDLDIPAGLDLAEYPVVDVSVEPLDGDPTHSGVSVARGELEG